MAVFHQICSFYWWHTGRGRALCGSAERISLLCRSATVCTEVHSSNGSCRPFV